MQSKRAIPSSFNYTAIDHTTFWTAWNQYLYQGNFTFFFVFTFHVGLSTFKAGEHADPEAEVSSVHLHDRVTSLRTVVRAFADNWLMRFLFFSFLFFILQQELAKIRL